MSLYLGETPIAVNSSSREIGEIVQSTIPLTDAGLHLLDGSLISGSGSYADFVTYIAGLVSTYPDLFETEANWQSSVSTYGVCGKFVYDSVNGTVRLPKRTSEHGDLVKSYVNGTDWYRIYSDGWCEQGGIYSKGYGVVTNAQISLLRPFANTNYSISAIARSYGASAVACYDLQVNIDNTTTSSFYLGIGSDSQYWQGAYWQACGYIDTTNLQLDPLYEYIVIATSTKTNIEVDIDDIATDLNGKADVDLSNMNPTQTVKNNIVGWGMPDYSAGISVSNITPSTPYTAPSIGFLYCNFYLATIYVNNKRVALSEDTQYSQPILIALAEGDVVTITANAASGCFFYPCKGVN